MSITFVGHKCCLSAHGPVFLPLGSCNSCRHPPLFAASNTVCQCVCTCFFVWFLFDPDMILRFVDGRWYAVVLGLGHVRPSAASVGHLRAARLLHQLLLVCVLPRLFRCLFSISECSALTATYQNVECWGTVHPFTPFFGFALVIDLCVCAAEHRWSWQRANRQVRIHQLQSLAVLCCHLAGKARLLVCSLHLLPICSASFSFFVFVLIRCRGELDVYGALPPPKTINNAVTVYAGVSTSCVLDSTGKATCW